MASGSPDLPPETDARVRQLYGGGEYTASRTVPHTLYHYKSFERLLIARCGTSIKQKKQSDAIVAQGGASLAEQAAALVVMVGEANAISGSLSLR